MRTAPKRTPLYGEHVSLGGRMVEFGGYSMPLQYTGILDEHQAVRRRAGLFDVSHMGEIDVTGAASAALVDRLVTGRAANLTPDRALYTLMCYPDGGVVDDLLVYRLGEAHFRLVVNAANTGKDLAWIEEHASGGVSVADVSSEVALLALQGPLAETVLAGLTDADLPSIAPFHFRPGCRVAGVEALISRTGYTGEDGFELFTAAGQAPVLWRSLLDAGGPRGVKPAGLGARDSLRLEARLLLYGQDLSPQVNPLEAGLSAFVKFDKGPFVGKQALEAVAAQGVGRKLTGFRMADRAVPRPGYPLLRDGRTVGEVTSGTFSPTLEAGIGLGFLPPELARPGEPIACRIHGRERSATTVPTPFYRRERA